MENCTSVNDVPWSPVLSAASNAQLAGVLASVALVGVSMLIALCMHNPSSVRIRALALFLAALTALGVGSHVFSHISGGNLGVACRPIWTQETVAVGLLGLGVVALVGAIWWLLAAYMRMDRPGDPLNGKVERRFLRDVEMLSALLNVMMYGFVTVAVVDGSLAAQGYLGSWSRWSGHAAPTGLVWLADYYWIVMMIAVVSVDFFVRRSKKAGVERTKAFKVAVFGLVLYAILVEVLVEMTTSRPEKFWESSSFAVPMAATLTGLLVPVPLLITLVCAVPHLRRGKDKGNAEGRITLGRSPQRQALR